MKKFNNWLAIHLGNGLGSMTFFYICVVLDLIELEPVIKSGSVIVWVTYISQTVIQLIALPILAVQQKLMQDKHDETISAIKAVHKHLGVKHVYRRKP